MKRFWVGFVLSVFGMASSQAIEIPGSSALAGVILNQYDNNTNDILDAGEWQTGSEDGYSKLDHNGDGKVSKEETKEISGIVGNEVGEATAKLIFPILVSALLTFDKDDDKEVTEKEFHEEMDKLFKKLDTNSDAEVTKKELKLLPLKLLQSKRGSKISLAPQVAPLCCPEEEQNSDPDSTSPFPKCRRSACKASAGSGRSIPSRFPAPFLDACKEVADRIDAV
jgi:hypothetical protein